MDTRDHHHHIILIIIRIIRQSIWISDPSLGLEMISNQSTNSPGETSYISDDEISDLRYLIIHFDDPLTVHLRDI